MVALFVLGSVSPAHAAEPSVSNDALEQSKRLFGEGQAAMDNKDFALAEAKFGEAYRLAPHLHLFNYNIAMAADLGGDCRDAQLHFQAFLDLVPEHPQRASAQKRLTKLKRDCPVDLESENVLSTEGRAERDEARTVERAVAAMNDILVQLQLAEDFYRTVSESLPGFVFKSTAARKKRQIARLLKLFKSHRIPDQKREIMPFVMPDTAKAACQKGRSQEGRTGRAIDEALKYFETKESVRVLNRLLRGTLRDGDAFDDCARK